jgi:ribosomal protein S18 acetylase RimI-like enzyme
LWRELTEWHRNIYQDPTIGGATPQDHFDEHLAKVGIDRLWVAVCDSRVVGLIGLIIEGNEAEIEPLIVSEAYRHRGIGKELLKTATTEARKAKVRFLNVKPVARNVQATKFFYKHGFKNLGHIELFIDFSKFKWKAGPKLFGYKFNF